MVCEYHRNAAKIIHDKEREWNLLKLLTIFTVWGTTKWGKKRQARRRNWNVYSDERKSPSVVEQVKSDEKR